MLELKLIDTHCHLQMETFKNDIDSVVNDAVASGIEKIINVGFDINSSKNAIELSKKYPFMFAAVGVHPHDAKTFNEKSLSVLDVFLKEKKVVAVGEIGLDFKRNLSPREIQIEVFRKQLCFAMNRNVPVVLHIRDAYNEVFKILERVNHQRVLLHCFSGNYEDAEKGLNMGYYLAFGGTITYTEKFSKVIKSTPIDKILLETDAPYLSPLPKRGKRNEPSFIKFTAEKIAQLKGVTIKELGEITTDNAIKFFRLSVR